MSRNARKSGNHSSSFRRLRRTAIMADGHSGSRAIGHAHPRQPLRVRRLWARVLRALDARNDAESVPPHAAWPAVAADAEPAAMATSSRVLRRSLVLRGSCSEPLSRPHNHVRSSITGDMISGFIRKGAMPPEMVRAPVLPGSMGMPAFNVEGPGLPDAFARARTEPDCAERRGAAQGEPNRARRRWRRLCDYPARDAFATGPPPNKTSRGRARAAELVKVTRRPAPGCSSYKGR